MSRKRKGARIALPDPPECTVAAYRAVVEDALTEDSNDHVRATYRLMCAWLEDCRNYERATGFRLSDPFPASVVVAEIHALMEG